jgi:protein-disulfide isomerase
VSKEAKILSAILVAVVGGMVALFMIANKSSSTPAPVGDKTKIIRDSSHKTGTGPVQLVEFGDFECPACGVAEPAVEQLLKDYNGKVSLYFRNFPLPQHLNAQAAAQAAEAAADQGKYWEMHNKLYATQKDWETTADPTDTFVGYAKDLGLDTTKFKTALTAKTFQSVIDQDTADATALSVNATPTFYFNGVKFAGGSSYAELSAKVDSLLKQ